MLENRSFDNVLGWLYDEEKPPKVNIPAQEKPYFHGLKENTYFNVDDKGNKHYVVKGTNHNMNVPAADPHEEYSHVNKQLFGNEVNPELSKPATMEGFYQDFAHFELDGLVDTIEKFDCAAPTKQIMMTYTPDELPVLNGLARHFAVSDYYFSSVPTQTNANRAFAACGNSLGETNTKLTEVEDFDISWSSLKGAAEELLGYGDKTHLQAWVNNRDTALFGAGEPEGRHYNQKTMWNVLSENDRNNPSDWMIYHSEGNDIENAIKVEGYSYTRDIMSQLQDPSFDQHFGTMNSFFDKAKAGTLPSVCFLEPKWGGGPTKLVSAQGNDYHPPCNLAPGEVFVKQIYDALRSNSAAWSNTLFIINFDEHGGTYDHISPPWNATQPWSSDGTPRPKSYEFGFEFDRFGVRVPLILVSPHVQESTVFRAEGDVPYDHTSVMATILKVMGIPKEKWGLGGRTANAPTFENVFTSNEIRTEFPSFLTNTKGKTDTKIEINAPENDIQKRRNEAVRKQQKTKEEVVS